MARVVVVDDDDAIRLLVGRVLALRGHDVRMAADGVDALDQIRREPADLVILDLMMPRLDGLSVIEELKRDGAPPPVIVMTAAAPSIAKRVPPELVVRTLGKPFEIQELIDSVASALEQRV